MPRTTTVAFLKGHGTGNDFVLLPDVDDLLTLTSELARGLCDRRTGLGADGVLRVAPAPGGGWFMDHRNADGSHAEMCGNGIRVFGRYLIASSLAEPGPLAVLTRGGLRVVDVPAIGDVTVDMGRPARSGEIRSVVPLGGSPLPGTPVDMGNPHVVSQVADAAVLAGLDLSVAPTVSPGFPLGVNAEFVAITGERSIAMRVHERGVGETRSCGTGACAAAAAVASWAGVEGSWEWTVDVPGGRLMIAWTGSTLLMTGPAVILARGTVDVDELVVPGW